MSISKTAEANIVFITRKWAPATGGMETYSLRLTEHLAKHQRIDVIALAGQADGMPPRARHLLGFPFTVLRRLWQRAKRPDVIHLGDMALWPLGLACHRFTRLVISAHGTDVAYHRRGGLRGRLYGAYLRIGARLLRGKAQIIANSQATRDVTAQTGWRDIAVVPLASDFAAVTATTNTAPSRTILFAGRLVKRKGCAWFIRNVLPLLADDITLEVAGTVWDEDERAALEHPNVHFLGALDAATLARKYAHALCVVIPNIDAKNGEYEGFGLIAPEAAAAGGVVLAADHGGLRDAVIDDKTGLLVATGDAQSWAARIGDVAQWSSEQRAAFSTKASASARQHFTWERVARQSYSFYGLACSSLGRVWKEEKI